MKVETSGAEIARLLKLPRLRRPMVKTAGKPSIIALCDGGISAERIT